MRSGRTLASCGNSLRLVGRSRRCRLPGPCHVPVEVVPTIRSRARIAFAGRSYVAVRFPKPTALDPDVVEVSREREPFDLRPLAFAPPSDQAEGGHRPQLRIARPAGAADRVSQLAWVPSAVATPGRRVESTCASGRSAQPRASWTPLPMLTSLQNTSARLTSRTALGSSGRASAASRRRPASIVLRAGVVEDRVVEIGSRTMAGSRRVEPRHRRRRGSGSVVHSRRELPAKSSAPRPLRKPEPAPETAAALAARGRSRRLALLAR